MQALVDVFLENPLASAFGVMGLLCQLTWPVFRAHRAIMTVQFGIGADYSIHYALLDAWSGAGVAGLGALQSALAYFYGGRAWFRRVGLLFLPVVAAISYVTWIGVPTLLAFTAVALIMIGRLQNDTLRLRILLLAAAPFGMAYDVVVGAAPALIGGGVSATIAAAMLVREIKARRPTVVVGAEPALTRIPTPCNIQ